MQNIPDLMTSLSGENIQTIDEWEKYRRPEIINLMSEYIYGIRPSQMSYILTHKIQKEIKGFGEDYILHQKIKIYINDFSFDVYGYMPTDITDKIPAFVYIMHEYQEDRCKLEDNIDCLNVDIREIVRHGYAVFIMPTRPLGLDQDHNVGYNQGIFPIFTPDEKNRKSNSWATISAWSWGSSRVLDYIETLDSIDSKRVIIAGHSRGGKTALWAAATDQRFAGVISNDSGCTGAAMHRTKCGEHIKDINKLAPTWFCENYHKYDNNEAMLPCDQHMLIASIAPRFAYIASSTGDSWADPEAERLSCRLAGKAYELYGKSGVILPEEPVKPNTAYHDGTIGYHVKTGEHGITYTAWKYFLDFFDKNIK